MVPLAVHSIAPHYWFAVAQTGDFLPRGVARLILDSWGVVRLDISFHLAMKTFEYCRKSTKDKEDQQVLSITGQHEENVRVAQRLGHDIEAAFQEEKSAKEPGREKFNRMLSLIEKGKADAILCWRLNRLARNTIDGGRIVWLLQNNKIQAIITPEKTYLPTDNVLPILIEFGMATQFSIDLGKDVKRGMIQKARMGWRPGLAPVGYLNDYGGIKGEKRIFKDPDRFHLVRQCWDYLLTGAHTVEKILDLAHNTVHLTVVRGRKKVVHPIGLNTLYEMFHNPFYCGEYSWDGKMWQGLHEPMISRAEFRRAQEILSARARPRMKTHENPYPCLIRCQICRSSIVIDVKKKFIKREQKLKVLTYFRCGKATKQHCSQKECIRQEDLDPQVLEVITAVGMPQAFLDWARGELKLTQEDKKKQREAELARLHEQHRMTEKKASDLIDMRLENPSLFPEESFKRKLESLEQEVKQCESRIRDFGRRGRTWREEFIDTLDFVERAKEEFLEGNPTKRIEMLVKVKDWLELNDRKLTFRLCEPFLTLSNGKKRMEEELGSLEPINCRLQKVKTDVLEKVIPIWSRRPDLNPSTSSGLTLGLSFISFA